MNNNSDHIISCGEMLSKVFSNIESSRYKEKEAISNAWKNIITSICKNNSSGENTGEKLYAHSSLVEIKNNILLIETDHPGFIQLFRIYEKYILNGLQKYVPQLEIKALSFRLQGSSVTLQDKKRESEESEKKYLQNQFEKEDKSLEKIYKQEKKSESKEIPSEIKDVFARMRKTMLTKDKK